MYFIQLRLPTRGNKLSAHDKQSVALKALCEDTGGVAFFPTSQRHLLQRYVIHNIAIKCIVYKYLDIIS